MRISIGFLLVVLLWGTTGCKIREIYISKLERRTLHFKPEQTVITSKGRKIPFGYIPLIWEKFRKYDVDNDNSFSPVELEGVPAVDLATMFKYIVDSQKINQFETINIKDAF